MVSAGANTRAEHGTDVAAQAECQPLASRPPIRYLPQGKHGEPRRLPMRQ
jgi:hypothetical protein